MIRLVCAFFLNLYTEDSYVSFLCSCAFTVIAGLDMFFLLLPHNNPLDILYLLYSG